MGRWSAESTGEKPVGRWPGPTSAESAVAGDFGQGAEEVMSGFVSRQKRVRFSSVLRRCPERGLMPNLHLSNARIWTADKQRPDASSMTIRQGRITALDAPPADEQVIDCKGAVVPNGVPCE